MSIAILKGLHRRMLGITHTDQVIANAGFVSGGEGKPAIVHPAPDTVAIFEDFLGDLVPDEWIAGSSDTGQATGTGVLATSAVPATNGIYRMTSSATSTQTPVGGAQSINTPPNWKADQGKMVGRPLRFGTRLKIADLAKNNVFAGFTDTGGTELAVYDTGGGIITPAADYAGWLKGGGAAATGASLTWRLVAGKAGTDQVAASGVTPTTNVYDVLEVEVSTDGNVVTGFINGVAKAQIISAGITPTVALGAGVWRANTEAAADAVDVDWFNVAAGRDTGV
jgi:hypothetical protein